MSQSEESPTLHNRLLRVMDEYGRSDDYGIDGTPSLGVAVSGFLQAHKKRRINETVMGLNQKQENGDKPEDGKSMDGGLERYERLKAESQQALMEPDEWAQEFREKLYNLRKVYIYGLSKV